MIPSLGNSLLNYRVDVMKWAYGITTVPERAGGLLPATIESLAQAGFDRPMLFVDGSIEYSGRLDVVRHPRVGQLRNWMNALFYLFTTTRADRYAIFEDDLLACRQLRPYLDRCPPGKTYWNLITSDDNLHDTGYRPGWHLSNQLGRGAVGLVFDRETVDCLLRMERFVRAPANGETMADAVVIDTLKPLGYRELVHYPSLLQHMGAESTLGHSIGQVSAFQGVEYDLLSIDDTSPSTHKSATTTCCFRRRGQAMICERCGREVMIRNPTLAPEKYRARCRNAEYA
jgi:hypothetical protein